MDLFYDNVLSFGNLDEKAMYNGNVSAIRWRNTANSTESSRYRNYSFRYDGTNRLLKAELGRWLCFDPMAEKAANWTPYWYLL